MKHTEETKQKIREKLLGRKLPEETKKKMSFALMGNKHCIGRIPWNKGIKMSEKMKRIISQTSKGKHYSPETEFKKDLTPWNKRFDTLCLKCGKKLSRHKYNLCISCWHEINKGERHYKWNGGSSEMARMRSSQEYKNWRIAVYKRDWFTCCLCGYKGRNIEAHHIKKVKDYPELILDINNGITFCQECHLLTRNKEEQYEEVFNNIVERNRRFFVAALDTMNENMERNKWL